MPAPPRPLVVTVADVSPRLGWRVPTAEQRRVLQAALEDAHDDVEAYLGQPIAPTEVADRGLFPLGLGWALSREPIVKVLGVDAELDGTGAPTGLFTVRYTWGLDAGTDPELRPIRRYITAAVLADPAVVAVWQAGQGEAARRVRSASTDGQAVAYDYLTPSGPIPAAGAAQEPERPTLASLDRWRVAGRRVFQRRGDYLDDPHPDGTGYAHGWYGDPPP